MGLDGGTIASRTDVLRRSSWRLASSDSGQRSTRGGQLSSGFTAQQAEERVSRSDKRAAVWSSCSLTGAPLEEPIVACLLGKLYTKESVVKFLLAAAGVQPDGEDKWLFDKLKRLQPAFSHVRSRKDVFELHFHTEAIRGEATRADFSGASVGKCPGQVSGPGAWVCTVTGLPLNGAQPCSALKTCGHVFSDRALKQVSERSCPTCSKAFTEEDVIGINRTEEEIETRRLCLKRNQEALREVKAKKKARKQDS